MKSEERFRFLAEAGELLAAPLGEAARLESLARLIVPRVADWCAVDSLEEDRRLRRVALVHTELSRIESIYELQRLYDIDLAAPAGLGHVLGTGRPEFRPRLAKSKPGAASFEDRQLQLFQAAGVTSLMIVPLVASGRTLGAITFAMAESRRRYTADDRAMSEALASRAALALENTLLYREAREQGEWLQGTLSSIGDAVIATDAGGSITFMNVVAESWTGWPQAEAMGRPLEEVFRIVDERTRAPAENPVALVLREGVTAGLANHTLLLSRGGMAIPIDDSAAPIRSAAAEFLGVVLVFRDITGRRRDELAQRQLAAIVESSEDAIFSKTLDGTILSWNAAAERIYGYTAAEMVGQSVVRIFPRERRAELEQILTRLRRGEPIRHYETERVRKDGVRIQVALTISPVMDSDGVVVGASTIARDITERKRAEQALRESRDQLAIILRGVADGITAQDPLGRLIYANDAAARITGYPSVQALLEAPPVEILSKFEILDADRQPLPVAELPGRLALQGLHPPGRMVCFHIVATGEERWSVVSAMPVLDEHGRVQFVINFFQDITERWRAEREQSRLAASLERERRRLDDIVSTVPGVVWEAWGMPDDEAQRIDFVSEYVETMLGYRVEEWLATPNFWLSIVHPDDKNRAALEAATIFAGGQVGTSEFRWIAKDGRVLWVEARNVVVCDEAGQPIGMRCITIDISERKRSEDTQRFLAQVGETLSSSLDYEITLDRIAGLAVPDLADWCAVHIVDMDGTIRRLAVAHIDPKRAAQARARPERYPIDPNAQHIVPQVIRSGKPEIYAEVTDEMLVASARDAEHLRTLRLLGFASYLCVPLLAHGRTLGAITLVMSDSGRRYEAHHLALAEELAHRAAAAIENAQLYREAQEAIRAREVFLSVASHELKTPLTTLLGNAQLFQRRAEREHSLGDRDIRSLQLIVEQARRLNRMIEALLDLSRLETGQLSIERRPLDLGALVQRVADEAMPGLEQHTITFNSAGEPLFILGDELRLEQALQNLLQNAIKYSPAGGRIDIRVARRDRMACAEVSDQGIGIPQAALPRLFTRFYRATNVNPQHISGMGVGLYVVKEIIALHGGEVGVESQEGVGSIFTVCLPLATI
jgi:PAS domain S-box-containing protein